LKVLPQLVNDGLSLEETFQSERRHLLFKGRPIRRFRVQDLEMRWIAKEFLYFGTFPIPIPPFVAGHVSRELEGTRLRWVGHEISVEKRKRSQDC